MAREFTFTDPGEGIHEAEIVEVTVSVGDTVEDGDTVLVVETDKAATELPSPYSGEVQDIPVSEGDTVEIGDVLMTFSDGDGGPEDEPEDDASDEQADRAEGEDQAADRDEDGDAEEHDAEEHDAEEHDAEEDEAEEDEAEKDEAEEDDEGGKAAAVGELPSEEPATRRDDTAGADEEREEREEGTGPVPASPATRRSARERGVDLSQVEPSGEHGRVTAEDVEAAAEARHDEEPDERPREAEEEREEALAHDHERWGPVEHVPLRSVRRTTARRVTESWQRIPHVTHHDVVDVTALERWRREQAPRAEEAGGDLTLMVLTMKAVASLLHRYPRFNASVDMDAEEIVLKRHYHLGIAVDTDDGLIVPVVRDVDRKPLLDLAVEVSDLIARVRDRDVQGGELQGGTFTITNVGPLGGAGFTPLIQHPQVAILGMGRARLEQVVTGDLDDHRTVVQFRLPLSLAYDHRVADGADAARFVGDLADAVADPGSLLLTT